MWPLTRRFTRILCTRPHGRKIEGGAAGQRRRWKGRDGEREDVRGRARQQGRTGRGGVRSCCSANITGEQPAWGAATEVRRSTAEGRTTATEGHSASRKGRRLLPAP